MWLLQHCNIRAMADLSQNLYSFASNATEHLKGVSYHALIHLNKNAASKQMMLLSLFLFLLYSNIVQLLVCFANLRFSFDIGQKSHVKMFVQASPEPHFVRRWAFLIQNYMCLCVLFNVPSRLNKLLMEGNYSMLIDGY